MSKVIIRYQVRAEEETRLGWGQPREHWEEQRDMQKDAEGRQETAGGRPPGQSQQSLCQGWKPRESSGKRQPWVGPPDGHLQHFEPLHSPRAEWGATEAAPGVGSPRCSGSHLDWEGTCDSIFCALLEVKAHWSLQWVLEGTVSSEFVGLSFAHRKAVPLTDTELCSSTLLCLCAGFN